MKKNNHIFRLAVPVAVAATALLTIACTEKDDFFGSNSGKEVKFTVVEESDWNRTRGAEASDIKILDPVKVETPDGSPLYLHTYVSNTVHNDNDATTRGAAITASNLEEFGVIGYKYDKSETYGDQSAFIEAKATKSGTTFTLEKKLYWPGDDDRFAFCAYAPYVERENTWDTPWVYVSDNTAKPQLAVTLSNYTYSNTGAPDLVVAEAKDQTATLTGENGVALSFTHPMTAIRFVVGDMGESDMRISSVGFQNVKYSGTYTIGEGWTTVNSSTTSFQFSPNSAKSVQDDDKNINTDETTLYMIPQEFTSDNAKLYVNVSLGTSSASVNVNMSLNGQQWEAGKTVTYVLNSSAVEKPAITLTTTGNTPVYDSTSNGYHAHTFVDGDKLGLFVVESDGTVSASNVQCSYDGTSWSVGDDALLGPSQTYYLYYPYKENLSGAPAKNSSVTAGVDASVFFSDVIENWPIVNDGTEDGFMQSSLRAMKGTLNSSNTYGFYITGNLSCMMGYVDIKKTQTYQKLTGGDGVVTYHLDTDENYTWEAVTNPTYTTTNLSMEFPADQTPIAGNSSNDCWVWVVKPNTDTVIKTTDTCEEPWSFTANVAANAFKRFTPTSYDYTVIPTNQYIAKESMSKSSEAYTMQVGDSFFMDGSLSHTKSSDQIGIVWYIDDPSTTDDDAYTEKGTVINGQTVGGHALIASKYQYRSFVNYPYWLPATDVDDIGNVTTYADMFNASNISGYKNNAAALLYAINPSTMSETNAFYYLKMYPDPAPEGTTGWFLPSAAQIAIPVKNSVINTGALPTYTSISAITDIQNYINQISSSFYTSSFYNLKGDYYFWTSTEYDASNAVVYKGSSYGFGYKPKTKNTFAGLWYFLAF